MASYYCLNNCMINIDCFIEDLGVTFQDDPKFCEHIKTMVFNANSKVGIINIYIYIFHDLSKEIHCIA